MQTPKIKRQDLSSQPEKEKKKKKKVIQEGRKIGLPWVVKPLGLLPKMSQGL